MGPRNSFDMNYQKCAGSGKCMKYLCYIWLTRLILFAFHKFWLYYFSTYLSITQHDFPSLYYPNYKSSRVLAVALVFHLFTRSYRPNPSIPYHPLTTSQAPTHQLTVNPLYKDLRYKNILDTRMQSPILRFLLRKKDNLTT